MIFIFIIYILSVIFTVYIARCVNHKDLDDVPFVLCLIPFVNIVITLVCVHTIFTKGEAGEKFDKWYRGR
jgi:hypothetical protein